MDQSEPSDSACYSGLHIPRYCDGSGDWQCILQGHPWGQAPGGHLHGPWAAAERHPQWEGDYLLKLLTLLLPVLCLLQWGTAHAEIMVPTVENPELTNVFPLISLKPEVGLNIAMHALSTARNVFFVLTSTFLLHSFSFVSQILSLLLNCLSFGIIQFLLRACRTKWVNQLVVTCVLTWCEKTVNVWFVLRWHCTLERM